MADNTDNQRAAEQLELIRAEHEKIAGLRQELAHLQEVERQCEQERQEIREMEEASAQRQALMRAEMARLTGILNALQESSGAWVDW